jgi:hypothetical protein
VDPDLPKGDVSPGLTINGDPVSDPCPVLLSADANLRYRAAIVEERPASDICKWCTGVSFPSIRSGAVVLVSGNGTTDSAPTCPDGGKSTSTNCSVASSRGDAGM